MRVKIRESGGLLVYSFSREAGDGRKRGKKARMAKDHCRVQLPETWSSQDLHPDLMALSVLLLVYPFTAKRIEMPLGVSAGFAGTVSDWTRLKIGSVDMSLRPRTAPTDSVPGLAYSGGTDSTAALVVMPQDTVLVFLDRTLPAGHKALYSPEAARYACSSLQHAGRRVRRIASDLEEIRHPVGFPVDWANAVPLILLADQDRLASASFGTIMESGYRIGHEVFRDYPSSRSYKMWSAIFAAAGLPLSLPVAGLSEVATSRIVLRSPYRSIAQSCVRGRSHDPCMNCYKCFRKNLLEAVIEDRPVGPETVDLLLSSREVQQAILHRPVKHENVIAYVCKRCSVDHPVLHALRARVRSDSISTSWMERWYSPSATLIHEPQRAGVSKTILNLVGRMNAQDESEARDWCLITDTPQVQQQIDAIASALRNRGFAIETSRSRLETILQQLLRTRSALWLQRHTGGPSGWLATLLRRVLRRRLR